jgi:hypothetical protein
VWRLLYGVPPLYGSLAGVHAHMLDQSAMAVAADALGYPGASEVIERDQLNVIQAYRMFLRGGNDAPVSNERAYTPTEDQPSLH